MVSGTIVLLFSNLCINNCHLKAISEIERSVITASFLLHVM